MFGEVMIGIVLRALAELGLTIEREALAERKWRRDHPCPSAIYFDVMARTLPRWRLLARAWARSQHRRFAAWCAADEATREQCKRLSDSATDLVLAYLADPHVVDDEAARTKRIARRGRRS